MPPRTGAVHVATTKRVYNGKTYVTHLLRRSIRKGKAVTHETFGNLSHLPDHVIDLIKRSLKGETFVPADDAVRITRSLPYGHVEAVLKMIKKLGFDELIASKPSHRRNLVVAMIVERLVFPSSKLANTRHWHDTTLAEELDVAQATEDQLYDAMDWLLQRQSAIENRLAKRHLSDGALVLYDVTSARPIGSWLNILLCVLAYSVEWHLRQSWEPLLFEDEGLTEDRPRRDPVAPAKPTESARLKKKTHRTAEGLPVQSFRTLMAHLGTRCRNTCVMTADPNQTRLHQVTEAD
jgi:hypothetical protein